MEQCHWSMKWITARKLCSVMEAVYRYKVTPKDNVSLLTTSVNTIHHYQVQLKGTDTLPSDEPKQQHTGYEVGDCVWTKIPDGLCTSYIIGRVTDMIGPQYVLVLEMPYHVRDLHPIVSSSVSESISDSEFSTQNTSLSFV